MHPHTASAWDAARAARLEGFLQHPKVKCLGEIGLDYHYDLSPRPKQLEAFEAQLDMALQRNLPVALHIREAHGEATDILRARYRAGRLPDCLLHCYSGSWESAKTYLSMGCYVSLSGSVTFKNAPKLHEVAVNVPLDRLLIETDCPYLAPEPMRGRRNEPSLSWPTPPAGWPSCARHGPGSAGRGDDRKTAGGSSGYPGKSREIV